MSKPSITAVDQKKLSDALKLVISKLSEKEKKELLPDLRRLYESPNGFPCHQDTGGRTQGETIWSCSRIGWKIKQALGESRGDGMMRVGDLGGVNRDHWVMLTDFRAAIKHINLFPEVTFSESPSSNQDDEISETEREQIIWMRVGQGEFRKRVLVLEPECRLTGVSDARFLRASHIKPWRVCTNDERLDGENGLMLAPHVDHLFDAGYISFSDEGQLLLSKRLPSAVRSQLHLDKTARPKALTKGQASYMHYHRVNRFDRDELGDKLA